MQGIGRRLRGPLRANSRAGMPWRLSILIPAATMLGAAAPRDGFEWADVATFVAVAIGILIVRRALRRRMAPPPDARRD